MDRGFTLLAAVSWDAWTAVVLAIVAAGLLAAAAGGAIRPLAWPGVWVLAGALMASSSARSTASRWRCSRARPGARPHLAIVRARRRNRTGNLLITNQVLCQLS